tara:strand:- start:32868 stop:33566 length:699 start_codon:yes stop_codon:yes gene_type:complete
MANSFFITGTDTNVGKTYLAAGLIKAYRQRGFRVSGFKPVASGAERLNGHLANQDALSLMAEASVSLPYEAVNPYCFEPAIAPHIAAKQAKVNIDMALIKSSYERHLARSEVVIVEGAGGWKVPLGKNLGFDDVAHSLNIPIILVVGVKLGCINHALLSEEAIINKGCRLAGWVGNNIDPDFNELDENMKSLKEGMTSPCLGLLKYQEDKSQECESSQINMLSMLDYLADFR